MGNKKSIISLRDLRFSYGKRQALRGITLDIYEGQFYGLVGPNGCGKTTKLDLILGIKTPTTGSVFVYGKDVRDYARRELARIISLVPQEYQSSFSFTVEEVVLMGRHPHKERLFSYSPWDREIAKEVMEKMELIPLKDRFITQLSGGEKQRVIFARAMAQQTPVLLLDEATSNMDIYYTLLCLGNVKQEVKAGKRTVIATFHDLNLASHFCDSLILMKEGKIVAYGPTKDVLTPENIMKTFGVTCKIYEIDHKREVIFNSYV